MRVVALPTEKAGPLEHTPFLLVFDRCTDDQAAYLREADLRTATKAAQVLVFSDELELDEIQLAAVDTDVLKLDALSPNARAFVAAVTQ
jgi:hypothetical protein